MIIVQIEATSGRSAEARLDAASLFWLAVADGWLEEVAVGGVTELAGVNETPFH